MPKPPITELWKLKLTPAGPKIVPRPDRECPKCYEVGEIVRDEPWSNKLGITRKCQNKECDFFGKEWTYNKSWKDYGRPEQKEYEKYLEKNGGSRQEFARKKIKDLW